MPRQVRERSKSGIYHVMVRGINRQEIFNDDEDRQRYIDTLQKTKDKSGYELYGYCLMDNHVHLLVKERTDDISQIMKRIGVSYAFWYNQKHERTGHVFQDRYKSEAVEDDRYFLAVLRYMHQNPLRAGIVENIGEFRWSSHQLYVHRQYQPLVDIEFLLGMFGQQLDDAVTRYIQFMNEASDGLYLEGAEKIKRVDAEVRQALSELLGGRPITALHKMARAERDEALRKLKEMEGISIRQIARISGLGRNLVADA